MIRSCAALYQAWTWAAKRNHVYSPSLSSRDGPSAAKVGTGDELAGGVGGGSGFSVGVDCADAGPAIPQMRAASAAWWMRRVLGLEILPMSSSSAVELQARKIPSRTRGIRHLPHWRSIRNRARKSVPQSETDAFSPHHAARSRDIEQRFANGAWHGKWRRPRGHHRPRPLARAGRSARLDAARRLRRAGDQGRDAGQRRHRAPLGAAVLRRRFGVLRRAQPEQEERRDRLEAPAREGALLQTAR